MTYNADVQIYSKICGNWVTQVNFIEKLNPVFLSFSRY